jgi:N-acetylneuraminic acid mutarotase
VAGGTNGRDILATDEIYDPAAGTWTPAPSMPNGRSQHSATRLNDGRVLVVGGFGAENSAVLWNPATNAWAPAAPMGTARIRQTATLLQDGKVLIVGGTNSGSGQTAGGYLSSAETYDAGSNTWTPAGEMASPRGGHTATLLPDGHVLVVGGNNGSSTLASVEDYDPGTGLWTEDSPMSVARWLHTTTLLPGGQAIVLGGADGGTALSSAERFNPSTGTWSSSQS